MGDRPRLEIELERESFRSFWQRELSPVLSTFGRLVYLTALRHPHTGQYTERSLAEQFGAEEAHRVLRASHALVFQQWLGYTLEQQKADLELYFSTLGGNRARVVELWLALEPYRSLIPECTQEEEKSLYTADLRTILGLLKVQFEDLERQ